MEKYEIFRLRNFFFYSCYLSPAPFLLSLSLTHPFLLSLYLPPPPLLLSLSLTHPFLLSLSLTPPPPFSSLSLSSFVGGVRGRGGRLTCIFFSLSSKFPAWSNSPSSKEIVCVSVEGAVAIVLVVQSRTRFCSVRRSEMKNEEKYSRRPDK